jgi:hypothetical protein
VKENGCDGEEKSQVDDDLEYSGDRLLKKNSAFCFAA